MESQKQRIKEIMVEHLKTKGYPEMTNQQIMDELKPIWIILEDNNLIPEGITFQSFCEIAAFKALQREHLDLMHGY